MKEFEINVTEARTRFADVLNRAAYEGGRVLIERHGIILCAVISCNELTRLRALPPEPDPYAEAERFWQEGKRALEEKLRPPRHRARRPARGRAGEARSGGEARTGAAPARGRRRLGGDLGAGGKEPGDGV